MNVTMEQEEDSKRTMEIADRICKLLRPEFANLLEQNTISTELKPVVEIDPIHKLDPFEMSSCLSLLDNNLGNYYEKLHGKDWKIDKLEEMQESGLVYVRFKTASKLIAFVSFMVVEDNALLVLYVYELQISKEYRRMHLGTLIMEVLQNLVKRINKTSGEIGVGDIVGISLTCFSDNDKLLSFYDRNGFTKAEYSPMDKRLRSGKVLKPEYYILLKSI